MYVPSMNIGFGITLNCSYESSDHNDHDDNDHDHDDYVGNGDDIDTDYDDEYDDVVMVMMCMNIRYIILIRIVYESFQILSSNHCI